MKDNNEEKQQGELTNDTNDQSNKHPSRKPSHRKTNSSIFFNGSYLFQPSMKNANDNQPPQSCTNNSNKNNDLILLSPFPNKQLNDLEDNNLNYSSDNNINSSVIIKCDEANKEQKLLDPIVKQKSFVSLINTLSYAKDKQENATDSYLLALDLCNGNKKNYNATSTSAIEEENTILVTESDFTIKKSLKKSVIIDSKEFPSKQLENNYERQNDELKISKIAKTISDLIEKKKEKENNIKIKLETTKKTLLSSFLSIANEHYNKSTVSSKDIPINKPLVIENVGQLKVLPQKKHNPSLSLLTNKLCLNQMNTNAPSNCKSMIPYNSKTNPRAKKKNLCQIETDYDISSLNRNNFSNAITVMTAKTNRINTSLNNNNNTSITMGTRSNSHLSKCKQRNASCNNSPRNVEIKPEDQAQLQEQEQGKITYNNQAIAETLSHLTYTKSYEAQDALDKVRQGKQGCYLILCKFKDTFIGLFKYYQERHKFTKIYGSESCQNAIYPDKISSVCIDYGNNKHAISNELAYNTNKSLIIFKTKNEFTGLSNE